MKIKDKILQGDCAEILKTLPSDSIDLIFADPPYWMRVDGVLKRPEGGEFDGCDDEWDNEFKSSADYAAFTKEWLSECKRVLKPNGSFWVIGGMQCIYMIGGIMQELGFWFINDVIWHKSNPTPNFKGTRLNNSHETLIWACKDKKAKFTFNYKTAKELNNENVINFNKGDRKQLGSVWRFAVCSGNERLKDEKNQKLHSTQKPQALLHRVIAISSKLGDIVLDPFGGTMTTAAAAKELGRNFIMIEKDEKYIKFGKTRLENIKFINSDIARAKFDEKPVRVSMAEMIGAGYFKKDEKFYLKNSEKFAILTSDGKLKFNDEIYDIHSLAAIFKGVKASRLNGFEYFQVLRDGQKIGINLIREQYRKERYVKR